jgi:hypothetical protein
MTDCALKPQSRTDPSFLKLLLADQAFCHSDENFTKTEAKAKKKKKKNLPQWLRLPNVSDEAPRVSTPHNTLNPKLLSILSSTMGPTF